MKATHDSKSKELKKKEQTEKKTPARKAKPKVELKEGMSEEEYQKKKRYYDYIRQLLGEDVLPAKIYVMSENYMDRYKFTFESMYDTLVYIHEIMGRNHFTDDLVKAIPIYHAAAQKLKNNISDITNINEQVDVSKLYNKRTIYIQPPKPKVEQIDISEIGGIAECPS